MFVAELNQSVSRLPGVGPVRARDMARLGIVTISDLLLHIPRGYEDRRTTVPLAQAGPDRPVNTEAIVVAHSYIGGGPKRTLKVHIRDDTGIGALVCFGRNFLSRSLPDGMKIRIYGTFARRFGELQATSFEFEPANIPPQRFGGILPIYPLAGQLHQQQLRKAAMTAVTQYGRMVDTELPESLCAKHGLLPTAQALEAIHAPDSLAQAAKARETLTYAELFFLQYLIGQRSARRQSSARASRPLPDSFRERFVAALPFELTSDQREVIDAIHADLEDVVPMARLLQGDVGSGKTVVALASALSVIESGRQVVLMAPTELLARQHADSAAGMIAEAKLDVSVAFLSGTVPQSSREPLLRAISTGGVDLVIGTHAVFTDEVVFRNLQYAIIDEQHRFGVLQRLALLRKAKQPDLLLMTATPIPRTLALTVFGDMQVSSIHTMPLGRAPVETHLARQVNESRVHEFVERELRQSHQAYFVYPVIDSTGKLDLRDAESMWQRLKDEVFPQFPAGLVHSRLAPDEKRETMERFRSGDLRILVATSVVEVGVDVPNATCMVVEHAERFGLSALHQLRGRVGRSELQGYCFLLYDDNLTDEAKERLKVLHETTDGFAIAEEDLRIRGPGDIAGVQQAGYLRFRVADLSRDMAIMNQARADAFDLLERDPTGSSPESASLRNAFSVAQVEGRQTPFATKDRQ